MRNKLNVQSAILIIIFLFSNSLFSQEDVRPPFELNFFSISMLDSKEGTALIEISSNFISNGDVEVNLYLSNEFKIKQGNKKLTPKTMRSVEPRSFFINSSLGILEFISIGVGYQFSEKVAITIKGSQTFITGASLGFPNWGDGLGFQVSYLTEFLFFNSISAEYIAYLETSIDESKSINTTLKGNYFDFNIGHENIYAQGLNVFWTIGICISAVKSTNILYSPSLKVGLNYNFQ